MRKAFLFMMVSANGYFEGLNHELDWHHVDKEFDDFAKEQLDEADTLLFGRVTYEMMASFWPTIGMEREPDVARRMNGKEKVVFSNTLPSADWKNTRLVRGDAAKELAVLKKRMGKSIAILGSSKLAASLADAGLIDEFRIMVNPVLMGSGHPLMEGLSKRLSLRLTNSRQFGNGNMLLCYAPAPPEAAP